MRDGNLIRGIVEHKRRLVFSLPMRDGNGTGFATIFAVGGGF